MAVTGLSEFRSATNILKESTKAIWKDHITKLWINPATQGFDLGLDIIGDETLNADCDVTDNYVESNKAYQDQITLKPKTYTVSGEVGELVWRQRDPVFQEFGQVAQKLEGVISFLPIRSKSFTQMKKTVMKASQWVDTASNVWGRLKTLLPNYQSTETGVLTNQKQAYIWLCGQRDNRMPVNIETPWGMLENYVITNLEFKQPKETKDKSYISITFKEFRTVSIQTVPFDASKYQGNAAYENQPLSPQGKTSGEDVSLDTEVVTTPSGKKEEVCRVPVENGFVNFTEEGGLLAALDDKGNPILDDVTYLEGIASAVDRCDGKIREAALREALESGIK